MGGLIARLLLESKYPKGTNPPSWFSLIRRVLFICTPHLGAPKALVESVGIEGASTITGDQAKVLTADPNFPSGYELLPASSREILFDKISNSYLVPYDGTPEVQAFGLSKQNLAKGSKVKTALDLTKKPNSVQYKFVYGTGLVTYDGVYLTNGLNRIGALPMQKQDNPDESGDGTVPAWSVKEAAQSATPKIPTWSGPGDHVGILQTDGFRQELYGFFGLGGRAPALAAERPTAVVSLNKRTYRPGEVIDALLITDTKTDIIVGNYALRRLDEHSGTWVPVGPQRRLEYRGAAPTVSLRIQLAAPSVPGAYD
jgi:hypothetical protein